ncbi:serine hydrolase [Algoriphagus sp. Y33]|uniref:serine hydrolase domain-containing protein n=1 Tax=Algoriphagus sp. Y33 TaxID=2772483 RepID=UPI00177F7CF7|nr:serine hydrolase domain-containing protein [Algoriphagus sp. Y33]
MKTKPFYLAFGLVLQFLVPALGQQTFNVIKADSLVQELITPEVPGGAILIAKNGEVLLERYFGSTNLEQKSKTDELSLFRIGSLTKQFTAVGILKLVQEHKIRLEDSVGKFFPNSPGWFHSITIKQLLNHTSGIKNVTELPNWKSEIESSKLSIEDILSLIWKEDLYFTPGTDFHYSNSNYIVLGRILENVSGLTYSQFLSNQIFGPLGMNHTYYDDQQTVLPFRSEGYSKGTSGYQNDTFINMELPFAAGGLLMNLQDFRTWKNALDSGNVIPDSLLNQAKTPATTSKGIEIGYGMGWSIGEIKGQRSIKHSGYINGFSSFEISLPYQSVFMVVFTNLENWWNLEKNVSLIIAEALGDPFLTSSSTQIATKDLEQWIGDYRDINQETRRILLQEGHLYICYPGGSKTRLLYEGNRNFQLENSLVSIEFNNSSSESFTYSDLGIPRQFKAVNQLPKDEWIYKRVILNEDQTQEYLGVYQFENGPQFIIEQLAGKIYGAVGKDKKEIVPFNKDHFFAKELDAILRFYRDENQQVIGLIKIQGDGEMKAPKNNK